MKWATARFKTGTRARTWRWEMIFRRGFLRHHIHLDMMIRYGIEREDITATKKNPPDTKGIFANFPCCTELWGLSVKKTPSTLGCQTNASDYVYSIPMNSWIWIGNPKPTRTWNEKKLGVLSTEAFRTENGKARMHSRVLLEVEHPVSVDRKS